MISCNCWILSKHYSGVNSALFGTIFSCRIIHIWCCSEFKNTQKTNLQYIRSLLNRWHLFERSINCCYCVFFMQFCWQIEHIEDYKLDILIQQWHRRDYLYSCVLTVFFFFMSVAVTRTRAAITEHLSTSCRRSLVTSSPTASSPSLYFQPSPTTWWVILTHRGTSVNGLFQLSCSRESSECLCHRTVHNHHSHASLVTVARLDKLDNEERGDAGAHNVY